MRESSWIETLRYTYGYEDYENNLGLVLLEMHESSWSDDLHLYRGNIEEEGLQFLTVLEMRNIYLSELLIDCTKLDSDIVSRIVSSV